MSLVDKKSLPNRLVDYVLVVGSADASARKDGGLSPSMLRRIPETDHQDFPLPPDVVYFCQPDGCYVSKMSRTEMLEQQKLFLFCLTEKDANVKRYGACLNFFRPCTLDGGDRGTQAQGQERTDDRRDFSDSSGMGSDDTQRTSSSDVAAEDDSVKCSGVLTSVCLLSHHGFFSTFKEILMTFRDLVEGCQVNGETVFDMESGWNRLIDPLLAETDPVAADLNTWIAGLLRAPTPQAGVSCVELELAIMPTLTLAYPDPSRFPLVDFPLHLPVDLLGPDRLIEVLTIVLLENKVVFQSRDYNLLSMCVMAVVALLFPLEYLFPIIPLLPTSMPNAEMLLLAPSPFIIGVPASFFHPVRGVFLPEDVYYVDLDSGQVDKPTIQPDIPLPPPKLLRTLKSRLDRCLEVIHTMRFPSSPMPTTKETRGHNSSKVYGSKQTEAAADGVSAGGGDGAQATPMKPVIQPATKLPGTAVDSRSHPLADTPSSPWPMSAAKRLSFVTGTAAAMLSPSDVAGGSSTVGLISTQYAGIEENDKSPAGSAGVGGGDDEIDGSLAADIVAVDVHIRVAFVQFLLSDDILSNYRRFLRTIRLHSRPVVMLQKNSFLASVRGGASPLLSALSITQALETFGEFELNPSTTVHWRIQEGVTRAVLIGDKHKWYKDKLSVVHYSVYEGCESLSSAMLQAKSAVEDSSDGDSDDDDDDNLFDSDSSWSRSSSSNSSLILITDEELVGDDGPQTVKVVRRGIEDVFLSRTMRTATREWDIIDDSAVHDKTGTSSSSDADQSGRIIEHSTLSSVNFARAKSQSSTSASSSSQGDGSEIIDASAVKAVGFSPVSETTLTADISAVTVHTHTSPVRSGDGAVNASTAVAGVSDPSHDVTTASHDATAPENDVTAQHDTTPATTEADDNALAIAAETDMASEEPAVEVAEEQASSSAQQPDSHSVNTPEADRSDEKNAQKTETGHDSPDFFSPNVLARQVMSSSPIGDDCIVPPLVPIVHQVPPSPGYDFEVVTAPSSAEYPKTQQLPIIAALAEEFDNVSGAAMGYIGTVAERTAAASTSSCDRPSRHPGAADSGKDQTRLRQIRLVSRHGNKKKGQSPEVRSGGASGHDHSPKTAAPRHHGHFCSPLHTQLIRRESNFFRRPSPIRCRSLSFNTIVDATTGKAMSPDRLEPVAEASEAADRYDKAVFGSRLGHGDLNQEKQVSDMETRWMKSQKKYFASPMNGDEHIFNPFPTFRRSLTDKSRLLPASKRLNNFTLEQPTDLVNTSENQSFLYEVTKGVLEGRGIPWLKRGKVERLLMTECMRQTVLNTISEATGIVTSSSGVPDIWLYKPVYRGIMMLLKFVLTGIEGTISSGGQEPIASSYHFLELCYSQFTGKFVESDRGSPLSIDSSKQLESPQDSSEVKDVDSPVSTGSGKLVRKSMFASEDDDSKTQLSPSSASLDLAAMTPAQQSAVKQPRTLSLPPQALPLDQRIGGFPARPLLSGRISPIDKTTGKSVLIRRAEPNPNVIHPATKAEESRAKPSDPQPASTPAPGRKDSGADLSTRSIISKKEECTDRRYLYEEFIGKLRSPLWDKMEFWETLFGDIVSQERQSMGLNDNPVQLIERFRRLSSVDRVCLEHEEDLALTGLLVNMAAFMVAMGAEHYQITNKIRRLVGRAHIGLQFSQHVYDILRVLEPARGNAFELWPLRSRQINRQIFMVHQGESMSGDMCIIEVSDLAIVLNDFTGEVRQRWFYEDIVRANYHPSSCVLCMWVREEDGVLPYNFWCVKKGRQLYDAVENYINGSSAPAIFGSSITGQFPVRDSESGEAAVLTLSPDGIACRYTTGRKHLMYELGSIVDCSEDGDIFTLYTADEDHHVVEHRFESLQVPQIVKTMMNIFSVSAAKKSESSTMRNTPDVSATDKDLSFQSSTSTAMSEGDHGGERNMVLGSAMAPSAATAAETAAVPFAALDSGAAPISSAGVKKAYYTAEGDSSDSSDDAQ